MCRGGEATVNGSTLDKCVRNSQILFWPQLQQTLNTPEVFSNICVVCTQSKPNFVKSDSTIYSIVLL